MKKLVLTVCAALSASLAMAETVTFTVTDPAGAPVQHAVIMADIDDGATAPESFEWPNAMAQHHRKFIPHVLIVPVGSEVEFPNHDRFRHHVYSFSKGNRFELKLYGREEARYVSFEKSGIVAVGCNIHDDMIGFIRVVETPYAIQTDENGVATLDLPEGDAALTYWHPYADDEVTETITVQAGGQMTRSMTLAIDN